MPKYSKLKSIYGYTLKHNTPKVLVLAFITGSLVTQQLPLPENHLLSPIKPVEEELLLASSNSQNIFTPDVHRILKQSNEGEQGETEHQNAESNRNNLNLAMKHLEEIGFIDHFGEIDDFNIVSVDAEPTETYVGEGSYTPDYKSPFSIIKSPRIIPTFEVERVASTEEYFWKLAELKLSKLVEELPYEIVASWESGTHVNGNARDELVPSLLSAIFGGPAYEHFHPLDPGDKAELASIFSDHNNSLIKNDTKIIDGIYIDSNLDEDQRSEVADALNLMNTVIPDWQTYLHPDFIYYFLPKSFKDNWGGFASYDRDIGVSYVSNQSKHNLLGTLVHEWMHHVIGNPGSPLALNEQQKNEWALLRGISWHKPHNNISDSDYGLGDLPNAVVEFFFGHPARGTASLTYEQMKWIETNFGFDNPYPNRFVTDPTEKISLNALAVDVESFDIDLIASNELYNNLLVLFPNLKFNINPAPLGHEGTFNVSADANAISVSTDIDTLKNIDFLVWLESVLSEFHKVEMLANADVDPDLLSQWRELRLRPRYLSELDYDSNQWKLDLTTTVLNLALDKPLPWARPADEQEQQLLAGLFPHTADSALDFSSGSWYDIFSSEDPRLAEHANIAIREAEDSFLDLERFDGFKVAIAEFYSSMEPGNRHELISWNPHSRMSSLDLKFRIAKAYGSHVAALASQDDLLAMEQLRPESKAESLSDRDNFANGVLAYIWGNTNDEYSNSEFAFMHSYLGIDGMNPIPETGDLINISTRLPVEFQESINSQVNDMVRVFPDFALPDGVQIKNSYTDSFTNYPIPANSIFVSTDNEISMVMIAVARKTVNKLSPEVIALWATQRGYEPTADPSAAKYDLAYSMVAVLNDRAQALNPLSQSDMEVFNSLSGYTGYESPTGEDFSNDYVSFVPDGLNRMPTSNQAERAINTINLVRAQFDWTMLDTDLTIKVAGGIAEDNVSDSREASTVIVYIGHGEDTGADRDLAVEIAKAIGDAVWYRAKFDAIIAYDTARLDNQLGDSAEESDIAQTASFGDVVANLAFGDHPHTQLPALEMADDEDIVAVETIVGPIGDKGNDGHTALHGFGR